MLADPSCSSRPIKLVFLCSPGNPTGTLIPLPTIRSLLSNRNFKGLVVVDEAYVDFAAEGSSAVQFVREGWENVVVMQTLSKGFGLAGIRSAPLPATPSPSADAWLAGSASLSPTRR